MSVSQSFQVNIQLEEFNNKTLEGIKRSLNNEFKAFYGDWYRFSGSIDNSTILNFVSDKKHLVDVQKELADAITTVVFKAHEGYCVVRIEIKPVFDVTVFDFTEKDYDRLVRNNQKMETEEPIQQTII